MADEVTPTETLATETTQADAAPAVTETETALGGADAEAVTEEVTDTGKEGETEGDAAEVVVPEAYELTFSEGITADANTIAEATPLLQELKLSNEQDRKSVV